MKKNENEAPTAGTIELADKAVERLVNSDSPPAQMGRDKTHEETAIPGSFKN
jgi:hypothetical protein